MKLSTADTHPSFLAALDRFKPEVRPNTRFAASVAGNFTCGHRHKFYEMRARSPSEAVHHSHLRWSMLITTLLQGSSTTRLPQVGVYKRLCVRIPALSALRTPTGAQRHENRTFKFTENSSRRPLSKLLDESASTTSSERFPPSPKSRMDTSASVPAPRTSAV
jgi:hypothetical protein